MKMKVILSRKGFDSQYGRYPSPILPGGQLVTLPIPEEAPEPQTYYKDLYVRPNERLIDLMNTLGYPESSNTRAHLDPDLRRESLSCRLPPWRPIFGTRDGRHAHLVGQKVGKGDIFLFFGWFKRTQIKDGHIAFDPSDKSGRHIIFGYLEIDDIWVLDPAADGFTEDIPPWARYHSHWTRRTNPKYQKKNAIYVSSQELSLDKSLPGGGVFTLRRDNEDYLVLTKPGDTLKSHWQLPEFLKSSMVDISYHKQSKELWDELGYFQSVARGQEFVIRTDNDEDLANWVRNIILRGH
jgi:hypothetical protein